MIHKAKQDAIDAIDGMGGWLIYYPAQSDAPVAWEHTVDDGYIKDLHRESGSPLDWQTWGDSITEIARQA